MLECNTAFHQQACKISDARNFLSSSNEENTSFSISAPGDVNMLKKLHTARELERSHSYDIVHQKPHPFRSPMVYLRSSSLYRKHSEECLTKLNSLNVHPCSGASEWCLDDELNVYSCSTTENTPFANVTIRPYYNHNQILSSNHQKSSPGAPLFESDYATMKTSSNQKKHSQDGGGSLRRRASSLDFLPDSNKTSKSVQQNGSSNKNGFLRSSSVNQRTGFRRKIAINETDTALSGLKEIRSKGLKSIKSGVDALFDAIERKDIDDLQKCIDTIDFDINELNSDQFTALDVASMNGEKEMVSLLLSHGAKENLLYSSPEKKLEHLNRLIENAEETVNCLAMTSVSAVGEMKDNERQLRELEWKLYMLKVMQNGLLNSDSPSKPPQVTVAPLTSDSVVVMIASPHESKEIITRYKVEWSRYDDFSVIEGEFTITDMLNLNYTINSLEKNICWYVRVSAGNIKGYSPWGHPSPSAVIPSSWHECDDSLPRYYGATDQLCNLLEQLYSYHKQIRTSDYSSDDEAKSPLHISNIELKLYQHSKKNMVIKSFHKYTNLIFNSAPKLLKKIKGRGIYLASLLYSEDLTRVLVTTDENLPIVECDDNYSKSFTQEFYWFSKTSCTWEDLQHMMYISAKSYSSHSVEIRRKLIQSALSLMNATGVYDLGPIHYKPFRDSHGSILLLSVNCVKKKHLNNYRSTTMKWMPIKKLIKKSNTEHVIAAEKLIPSIQEHISSHRRSRSVLSRGLYLGYLKLQTTVDTLSVIVPNNHTNVLPYVKIQDVPNVTKNEWNCIKNQSSDTSPGLFQMKLMRAVNKLFSQLGIPKEKFLGHRIYDQEVIELNSDVMMIVICPPIEDLCTPPNQSDIFSNLSAYSSIPVQSFEMSNMMTYQPKLMSAYCRLSSILELENYCMQQNIRECICQNEMKLLKEKQTKLADIQQAVDALWRTSRWVVDTLNACQDKNLNVGCVLSCLMTSNDFQPKSKLSVFNDCDESVDELSDSFDMSSSVLSIDSSMIESDVSFDHRRKSLPFDLDKSTSVNNSMFISDVFKKNIVNCESANYLTIYATRELGLTEQSSIELTVDGETTSFDVIEKAATQFLRTYPECSLEFLSETNRLCLAVVTGPCEKFLPDNLNLIQLREICETGNLHLKLKNETVCGFITSV